MIEGTGAEPFLVDDDLVRHPSSTVMIPVKDELEIFGVMIGLVRRFSH